MSNAIGYLQVREATWDDVNFYPGRQLYIGLTEQGRPMFLYLVTGRSEGSRKRVALPTEDSIVMWPSDYDTDYNPLIHYTAAIVDNKTGLAVVTNGIQTEAIFETYKLLANVDTIPKKSYMKKLLEDAKPEPDSLHTPRIAGVITYEPEKKAGVHFIGTVRAPEGIALTPETWRIKPSIGFARGIQTYNGSMEKPEAYYAFDLMKAQIRSEDPLRLAEGLFNKSLKDRDGPDIRVCSIAGVFSEGEEEGTGKWDLAMVMPSGAPREKEVEEAAEKYSVDLLLK